MENASLYSAKTTYIGDGKMDGFKFQVKWWFVEVNNEANTFKFESKLSDFKGNEFENPKGKRTFKKEENMLKLKFQDSDTDFDGEINFWK